ncbi:sensor histidine kinase [Niastella vici]|uniref:sensor histidine kinase n=1 Tax=Niastella vici TaxID=1703345 RepID=UPI001301D700|nr:sensor histidine kinase [Niastella vici]
MRKKGLLFLFIIFGYGLCAQSKVDSLVFYQLNEQNGLSDNLVNCFFQDSKGFMWIGTEDGLNRYDGSAFNVYKSKNKTATELADNDILSITEDRQHHLWIGTKNGLSQYDAATNSFHTWRTEDGNINNILKDILIDSTGTIWLATLNGLLKFNSKTNQFTSYLNNTIPAGYVYGRSNHINKILIDTKNRFWLCTYNGVWRFYPASAQFEQYIGKKDIPSGETFTNTIFEDAYGKLWLGLAADGVQLFDPETKTLKDELNGKVKGSNLNSITAIRDIQGHYLLNAGIFQFNPVARTSQPLVPQTPAVAEFTIRKAYTSKDNLLWWGTDKGLRIVDLNKRFFHNLILSSTPVTHQSISLLQKGNALYIGASGNDFLKLYDSTFRLQKEVLGNKKMPALLNIVREDDSNIWLCTEKGLVLLNEENSCTKTFRITNEPSPPTINFISNLFIDSRGNHWVFPWRSGIWQIDKNTGRFKKIFTGFLRENNETKKLLVAWAVEDATGNIWMADLDEGVIHYNPASGTFSKPTEKAFGKRYTLTSLLLNGDWVWGVITGKVFRIHIRTQQIEQWNIPDEFNTDVHGFCQDMIGNLWITTRKGLLSFNKQTHLFNRYTTNDGLMENTMTEALWPLQNGKIIYTAPTYLTIFDPAELLQFNTASPVLLTAVYSQNMSCYVQQKSNGGKFVDLDYTHNNFTFHWAVQNYNNPLLNQYYYKMERVDADWKYAGNKGIIQYAGLSPGKYIFRVRGAGSNGVINKQGDYVVVIIHSPFWKTAWFVIIIGCGVLTLLVMVIRYISQRNLRERILKLEKEQAIEKERNRISRDMHDSLGSGLTKIAILSEVVKKQLQEPEKAKQQLETIAESSRELVDNLQDIIWVLNPQNDTLESLAAYIREYALQFFEPFEITTRFYYPEKFPDIKLSDEIRRNTFLTVKEAFNNIGKHAWCNKVVIGIEPKSGAVIVTIQDDGKGFDASEVRQFGNGLLNMQHRLKQVGGECRICAEKGKGTHISIEIPSNTFV